MVAHNCHGKTKNLTAKTKYLTAKPKTSRQKQKPHGKTKNLTAKQNTSRQNQILHSKNKIALVLPWVFAFVLRYLVFAVKYLVLPWGFWFCRELFCFCREVFGFAMRFLFLPWGFRFCREVFCFCRDSCGPPYLHRERRSSQNAEALAGCWSCDLLVAFTGDGRLESSIPKQIVGKARARKYNGRELGTGKAALSVPFFPPPPRFPWSHAHFRVPPMRHP